MSRDSITKAEKSNETWAPDIGDVLYGKLLSITDVKFSDREAKLATIDDEETGPTSFWLKAVLKSEFERLGVMRDDVVGVKYLGKAPGKKYFDYIVEREDGRGPLAKELDQTAGVDV